MQISRVGARTFASSSRALQHRRVDEKDCKAVDDTACTQAKVEKGKEKYGNGWTVTRERNLDCIFDRRYYLRVRMNDL